MTTLTATPEATAVRRRVARDFSARPKAVWLTCASGLPPYEHSMRDYCSTCAPHWYWVPSCADCSRKLLDSGWCRVCRRYSVIEPRKEG